MLPRIIMALDSIADKIESQGFFKEAHDIDVLANTLEADQYLQYRSALRSVSGKFQKAFGVAPQINEVRTSRHPEYIPSLAKGTPGYVDFNNRVLYVDFDKLQASGQNIENFVAHELGHWLDQYLGGIPGKLAFSARIYPAVKEELGRDTKYKPEEAFASTIDHLLTDGTLPGPAEKIIYNKIQEALTGNSKMATNAPQNKPPISDIQVNKATAKLHDSLRKGIGNLAKITVVEDTIKILGGGQEVLVGPTGLIKKFVGVPKEINEIIDSDLDMYYKFSGSDNYLWRAIGQIVSVLDRSEGWSPLFFSGLKIGDAIPKNLSKVPQISTDDYGGMRDVSEIDRPPSKHGRSRKGFPIIVHYFHYGTPSHIEYKEGDR